jgi:serine O-acetyltransferase
LNNEAKVTISATIPDWEREKPRAFWDPGRKLLHTIRQYQYWHGKKNLAANTIAKVCILRYRFWSVVCGADIPLNCKISGGLLIPHPNGIVIHPEVKVGVNCLILQQVTIGVNRNDKRPPRIGGHVDIGAGAKIIGNLTIGDHALIGANAVVVKDIEPYAIVAGVPAKVIGYVNRQK